jgi:hypothetical protein
MMIDAALLLPHAAASVAHVSWSHLEHIDQAGKNRSRPALPRANRTQEMHCFYVFFVAPPTVSDRNFCNILNSKLALLHHATFARANVNSDDYPLQRAFCCPSH